MGRRYRRKNDLVSVVFECSGSMIPDTNVGGKIATISEVSDDQKTTFLYS